MKKNQVNSILVAEAKRKNHIISLLSVIIITFIIAVSFLLIFINKNKNYYVSYDEKSDIDYKVYLNDNNFYDTGYLTMNSKYIASLIKNIEAKFNYEVIFDEKDVDFTYKYRIDATVEVKENETDNKSIFTKTKSLVDEKEDTVYSNGFRIKEELDVDYNEYNELIKSFIGTYDLEDTYSTLTISMYVDILGSCDDEDNPETSVISLEIPLTTKTIEINIKDNLVNNKNNILLCKKKSMINYLLIVLSIGMFILDGYLIYRLIKYVVVTRSAKTIYEINLKRILNNYHSYIQKVSNKMEIDDKLGLKDKNKSIYKECEFYRLETFTDLLEIRDSISAPILMFSNIECTATYFMILNIANKAVYIYALKVTDIKKKLHK